jgi:hypothetical protein
MTSDIRDDKVEAVLEMSGWCVERLGTGGVPVDADHRRSASIAPVKVVQAQAVDRQECTVRLRESRHRSSLSRYPLWHGKSLVSALRLWQAYGIAGSRANPVQHEAARSLIAASIDLFGFGHAPCPLSRGERELYALFEAAHICRARVAPATPGQYNALQRAGGAKRLEHIAQVEQ